jgi:DNA-binding MarR family transcriptional regulator
MVVDALEDDLQRERHVPLPWLEVLMQLTSAPDGRLKMQELAHSVLLSKSGVTRLVDRIAEAGLVNRGACETDRRVVYAMVTPAGRAALRDALPAHEESLTRHFSNVLTPTELGMLRSTLAKVLNAGGFAPTPCPAAVSADADDAVPGERSRRRSPAKR